MLAHELFKEVSSYHEKNKVKVKKNIFGHIFEELKRAQESQSRASTSPVLCEIQVYTDTFAVAAYIECLLGPRKKRTETQPAGRVCTWMLSGFLSAATALSMLSISQTINGIV